MTTRAALIWIILGIGMTCAMRGQWLRPTTRIIRSACRSMRMTGCIDCSFTSIAQCNATASGRGAQCFANPYFTPRERAAPPAR